MELIRNSVGICEVEKDKVTVKDHKGNKLVNCSVNEFVSLAVMVSAVYSYKSEGVK